MKAFRIVITGGILLFLFSGHENNISGNSKSNIDFENTFPAEAIKSKIETGDIILRSGKGFISDVFRQFSLKDKRFSHSGIVSVEKNRIFVYHILGDERSYGSQVRKELLDSFCNGKENNSFAVYRYDLTTDEKKNMVTNLQLFSERKIKFDSHFDLETDSAMYCTELVYKAVEATTGNKQYLPYTIINGNKYIAPDNLYMNRHSKLIYSYIY
jgi:hypothetical protein